MSYPENKQPKDSERKPMLAEKVTMDELRYADGKMQVEVTSFGQADPPEWKNLRVDMNKQAKRHFKSRPFSEVIDEEVPPGILAIFNLMCDAAEKHCSGYIGQRFAVACAA
jgi:hypothetical protein